jgi:hypothetical protein
MTLRLGALPRVEIAASQLNEGIEGFGRGDDADLGFSVREMQSVARRQLTGSIVVGLAIAVIAGLTALRPNHSEPSFTSLHTFPVVEQPIIAGSERHLASTKLYQGSSLQPSREHP